MVAAMAEMQITKNPWRIRVWVLKFRFGDLWYTSSRKIKFQFGVVQLSKYMWTKCKNSAITWKYSKYSQIQYIFDAVFLVFGGF